MTGFGRIERWKAPYAAVDQPRIRAVIGIISAPLTSDCINRYRWDSDRVPARPQSRRNRAGGGDPHLIELVEQVCARQD